MNIAQKRKTGFTLIELLVIIAIIGVLVNLMLPTFNIAKDKAVDAKVVSTVVGVRAEAVLFQEEEGTFIDMCISPDISNLMNSSMVAVSSAPTNGGLGDGECFSTNTAWAAWVNMRSQTVAYCVDSTGNTKEIPVQDSSAVDLTACP